ncbi:MAG: flavodoxin domain-containing protein [Prolixibacteraceae bacterium]|nr:flavodoxin domain-containing protein [Prolixibacteraceae bacterium]
MKKNAVIAYHSNTGTTKKYAEEIGNYMREKEYAVTVSPLSNPDSNSIEKAVCLLLGCWTSGLFFFLQHPEKPWKDFTNKLPVLNSKKVVLFTTYKVLTGSMFRNMRRELNINSDTPVLELKSKNGELSQPDKELLDAFLS